MVLPTRDLVTQVRETFEAVAKGCGLQASRDCSKKGINSVLILSTFRLGQPPGSIRLRMNKRNL